MGAVPGSLALFDGVAKNGPITSGGVTLCADDAPSDIEIFSAGVASSREASSAIASYGSVVIPFLSSSSGVLCDGNPPSRV